MAAGITSGLPTIRPRPGLALPTTKVQLVFAESHAAAVKNTVIRIEKTMGVVKAYLQLKAVIATKQMASADAMLPRIKTVVTNVRNSHKGT